LLPQVHATATILNNTGAVMVFGGTRDRDDLQFWSTLTGERDEPITTTDLHGRVASRTVRKVPVLPAAQIANLPTGRVLVIRRGIGPVIGRAQMAWRRRDLRRLQHATQPGHGLVSRSARWLRLDRLDVGRLELERLQTLGDEQRERALVGLAGGGPHSYAPPAARVRDTNAMFCELRRIQQHPHTHPTPDPSPMPDRRGVDDPPRPGQETR